METEQRKATGAECRLMGAETEANDPLEAWVHLAGVPSPGDRIAVWRDDRSGEEFIEVEFVTWPAWQYEHDPGVQAPTVWLRREQGMTDDEWRDVFHAMHERRHP